MTRRLRYLSLFSGVGGFDLGFDRAGMDCAGQVEIDEYCRRVLEKHWPDVKRMADIREVKGHEFGAVDIVAGGFPCQDVSVAGRREGLAGKRSGLWFEFHRLIDAVKPGTVVIENVPGLLSSHEGRDFATVLRGLVECGYGVAWRILDAQYFGVPQRRRRVLIVASLGDGRAAEILFERESGGGDITEVRSKGQGAAAVVGTLSANGGGTSRPAGQANELDFCIPYVSGGNSGGSFGVRRPTPIECERLQGFPDNHTAGQSDSARYRQMGNAVAVPVAEWIGRRIVEATQ